MSYAALQSYLPAPDAPYHDLEDYAGIMRNLACDLLRIWHYQPHTAANRLTG